MRALSFLLVEKRAREAERAERTGGAQWQQRKERKYFVLLSERRGKRGMGARPDAVGGEIAASWWFLGAVQTRCRMMQEGAVAQRDANKFLVG